MRHALALLPVVALAGCGLFGGDDRIPPAPLPELAPELTVRTVWSRDLGGSRSGQALALLPAVTADRVYAATPKGRVVALDSASGASLWETDTGTLLSAGPGVGGGLAAVATTDGHVLGLDAQSGAVRWRSRVSSEVLAPPGVGGGIVAAHSVDGRLYGLDAQSGRRLWAYESQVPLLTLRGTGAPVVISDAVLAGFDGGRLVALTLRDGRPAWEARLATPRGRSDLERMVDIDSTPVVVEDTVYAVALHGTVGALELASGRPRWQRELSSHAGLTVDPRAVYVTDDKDQVWALDRSSGRPAWRQDKLGRRDLTAPAVVGRYVVVGDFEGYLHWMRREDGRFVARQRVDKSGFHGAPRSVRGTLYVYGRDGTLAALRPEE